MIKSGCTTSRGFWGKMIKSRCRDEDLCADGLAHVCPMRSGKQGPREGKAGKAGRGASQHRSPRRQRQPAPAGDSGGGATSQPVSSPDRSAPPHACTDNHRLVARAGGGNGGCWASNSQASSDLGQHVPGSLGLGPPTQRAKGRSREQRGRGIA